MNGQAVVIFRLADILKEKGLTQRRAAELTGLSENAVSLLTRKGLRQIRLDTLNALCSGLEITPADLLVYREN